MAKFKLPVLEYDYADLEPSIDTETMKIHHTKHHQAYVDNLNKLSDSVPSSMSLNQMISGLVSNEGLKQEDKQILLKHGGGHFNHSLFWQFLAKESNISDISTFLNERIVNDFGSLSELQKQFDEASAKVFGSGWAWWVYDYSLKKSFITSTKDQFNPVMENPNVVCLLCLDVWEHAYYLKYQNRRVEYISSFWKVVNWRKVSLIHDQIVLNLKKLEITDDGYIVFN